MIQPSSSDDTGDDVAMEEENVDEISAGDSSPSCKGNVSCPHIHEHFTIHKWLRQTAYILTHNLNNLEHIANNCMNTTMHTDANIAQF